MRRVLGAGLALGLAACATRGPAPRFQPPPPTAPVPARMAAILGHGVYRSSTGAHGSCAGQSVALMHDTTAFRKRMVALYGSSERALLPVAEVQSRSAKLGQSSDNPLVEATQCGADGGFAFRNLQPGSYFLIARTHQGRGAQGPEQYVVMLRVVLNEGEFRDLDLGP